MVTTVMLKGGNLPTLQHVLSEGVAMFPNLSQTKNVENLGRNYGYVYGWIPE